MRKFLISLMSMAARRRRRRLLAKRFRLGVLLGEGSRFDNSLMSGA